MDVAGGLLTSGPVYALGWALVHFLWQGCIVAVLYWLTCVLSQRENAALRYWAGVVCLVLSVVAVLSTFVIYYEPDAVFVGAASAQESNNGFLVLSGRQPDLWHLLQDGLEPALPFVVTLWLAGVSLLSVRTFADWWRIRAMVRHGVQEVEQSLRDVARRLSRQMGHTGAVRIFQSTRVAVPMAVGWLRPVVLLPAAVLTRLPREQLEMVLAHELGHIARYDHIVNWLQIATETALFYHPAIGWVSRRVREERENCCDDLVVTRCRKPATYARALANLELLRCPEPTEAMMAATGGHLLSRIRRIIDSELPRSSSGYAQITMTAVLALVVALGTHQGIALSRALNEVASLAQMQPSDITWKTWGRSRSVWGEGLSDYAGRVETETATAPSRSAGPGADVFDRGTTVPNGAFMQRSAGADGSGHPPSAAAGQLASALVEARGMKPVRMASAALLEIPARQHAVQEPAPAALTGPAPLRPVHPVATKQVRPRYPWRARIKDIEGFVELEFAVDSAGRAYDIEVVDAFPAGVFERAAEGALKKWRFDSSVTAEDRLTQSFDFKLDDIPASHSRRRNCSTTGRRTCSLAPSDLIVVYVNPPKESTANGTAKTLD